MTKDTLVGRTLDGYRIVQRLDRSSRTTVYLAEDRSLPREVEFKVLAGVNAADAASVARFRQEISALARLEHAGIARIYDSGVDNSLAYVVTEHSPEGSLAARLARAADRQQPLSYDFAVTVGTQVAEALAFAHKNGVVHGEITPESILLTKDGRAVVADLGMAHLLAGLQPSLADGYAAQYLAPEQGRGELPDARSDIYALGAVLYEILTGRPPFQAETPAGLVNQHNNEPLLPIRRVNPRVPAGLAIAVQKALAKDPGDRYQTSDEMIAGLRSGVYQPFTAVEDVEAATVAIAPNWITAPLPPEPPPPPRRRERFTVVFAMLAIAAMAAIVLAAFSLGLPQRWFDQDDQLASQPTQPLTVNTVIQEAEEAVPGIGTSAPVGEPETVAPAGEAAAVAPESTDTSSQPVAAQPAATEQPTVTLAPTRPPAATPKPTRAPARQPTPAPGAVVTVPAEKPNASSTVPVTVDTATSRPPSPTPAAMATPPQPTAMALESRPGVVLDFEQWAAWQRGNEPYAALSQVRDNVHEGEAAAQFTYDFPVVDNNYAVFMRQPPARIPGQPDSLTTWVYGDGSGLFLNAWIRDSQGEVRQFPFGRIQHRDAWQPMVLRMDPTAAWPQGHISGPDDGKIDYPVELYALVLDAEGLPAISGQVVIDDVVVGGAAPVVAATPAATAEPAIATPAASTPTPGTAIALAGRIVYPEASGGSINLMAVDAATGNTWMVAPNARQPDALGPWVLANGVGGDRNDVFVASITGGNERITGLHPEDTFPNWSPSGDKAIFSSSMIDGQERIYKQEAMSQREEPAVVQVGEVDILGRNPVWIDDLRFAFSGCNYWDDGSKCGIWVGACDCCTIPNRLTDQPSDVVTETMGGTVLYHSRATGNWDVYAVPSTGGAPRNLTNSPSQDAGATFSPDGRSIAFMSDRDGSWGIWVMDVDGGNVRKLLTVDKSFGPDFANDRLAWGL